MSPVKTGRLPNQLALIDENRINGSAHKQALEDATQWATTPTTDTTKLRTCRRCHQYVITALDDHRCGWPITCDPTNLVPLHELHQLLTGNNTYNLYPWRYVIRPRTPWHIKQPKREFVIAEHRHGNNTPPTPEIIRLFIPTIDPLPEKAPF